MTDENERPEDVVEGFDLPGAGPTPSPEEESPDTAGGFDLPEGEATPAPAPEDVADIEQAVTGRDTFEPHVRQAERPQSVTGKIVALIVIPLVAVVGIFVVRAMKRQPVTEYKGECITTALKFLKGLSDDTATSVPKAYGMLYRDLRERVATEVVMEDYAEKTKGLGKFQRLGSVRWDETAAGVASSSFRSLAQFEAGEQLPVWFKFARVSSKDKTEIQISAYKFGAD